MSPNFSAKSSSSDGAGDADAGRDACRAALLEIPALATLYTVLWGIFSCPPHSSSLLFRGVFRGRNALSDAVPYRITSLDLILQDHVKLKNVARLLYVVS